MLTAFNLCQLRADWNGFVVWRINRRINWLTRIRLTRIRLSQVRLIRIWLDRILLRRIACLGRLTLSVHHLISLFALFQCVSSLPSVLSCVFPASVLAPAVEQLTSATRNHIATTK